MTGFRFDTITPSQALGFNGETDTLALGADSRHFVVTYDAATGLVTLTNELSGKTVVFGSGLYSDAPEAGSAAAPEHVLGDAESAVISGRLGADHAAAGAAGGGASGQISGDMDQLSLSTLYGADIVNDSKTSLTLLASGARLDLTGTGFTYDANFQLVAGTTSSIHYQGQGVVMDINVSTPVANFGAWVAQGATQQALSTILAGHDVIEGGRGNDLIRTYAGNDVIYGAGGNDQLFGGDGDDAIYASARPGAAQGAAGSALLRGDNGNDTLVGGDQSDDILGGLGDDNARGGLGNDTAFGGDGADQLQGEAGADYLHGNRGADHLVGGDGADTLRGGQNDDIVEGGAGADWLAGDRGADTISGGAGADVFHSFSGAGLDRITDFAYGEGDRLNLAPGTTYQIAQVGADTVVTLGGADQVVLVGVSQVSLGAGWISAA
ncbi:calcium-binding protein [Phenylobacterium sp. Root700]|uniref:calcium-binding protein n=1 Tax=Phenylobacterium sp. Root700 TaxID=1736591 RepID=UPI0006FE36AC|nr:calcium-binding protein [Phenylobacterium sp. Root700]KRB42029.1 hypothetical protein ASE02_04250 [Phenylobacterium sp. Root700]